MMNVSANSWLEDIPNLKKAQADFPKSNSTSDYDILKRMIDFIVI